MVRSRAICAAVFRVVRRSGRLEDRYQPYYQRNIAATHASSDLQSGWQQLYELYCLCGAVGSGVGGAVATRECRIFTSRKISTSKSEREGEERLREREEPSRRALPGIVIHDIHRWKTRQPTVQSRYHTDYPVHHNYSYISSQYGVRLARVAGQSRPNTGRRRGAASHSTVAVSAGVLVVPLARIV